MGMPGRWARFRLALVALTSWVWAYLALCKSMQWFAIVAFSTGTVLLVNVVCPGWILNMIQALRAAGVKSIGQIQFAEWREIEAITEITQKALADEGTPDEAKPALENQLRMIEEQKAELESSGCITIPFSASAKNYIKCDPNFIFPSTTMCASGFVEKSVAEPPLPSWKPFIVGRRFYYAPQTELEKKLAAIRRPEDYLTPFFVKRTEKDS